MIPAGLTDALLSRRGLKSRYQNLDKAAQGLTIQQAQQMLAHIGPAAYFGDVLSGTTTYLPGVGLSQDFDDALKSLFDFAFSLLGDLESSPASGMSVRDALYQRAYDAMPGHFCPFCGIDRFEAPHPDMPRHALDHYLAISAYPIFGAHLPNLVPMCSRCNSSFKLATNMLVADDGSPRTCVNPYGKQTATFSLANSVPFANGHLPAWVIDFVPPSPAFETWDQVFGIRLRYRESLLNAEYKAWLDDFAKWAVDGKVAINDNQAASDALSRWALLCPDLADQGFIKRPMFEMLAATAQQQNELGNRVTGLIRALCAP